MHRLCLAALLFTSCVWLVVGSIESQPYGYRHKQSDNIYYNDESSSRDTRGHNEVNNNPSMIDKVLQTAKSALFPGSNYGRDADNLQYATSHASSEMERGKDAVEEAAKMTRRSGYSSSGYSSGYYGRGGEDCDVNCDSRDVNCKRCDNSDYNRGGSSSGGGLSGFFGFGSGNSGSNNYGRDTANYAKDKMRQGVDSARDTANYGKDKVRQGVDAVRDTATYGSNKLQDAAYYGRDKLQQGADSVKDSIKDTAYYTKDKLQQGADVVRDMSARAQDRMRDTAYYATDRLADSAERAKDVLKDTYYRAADTAADTAYDWGGRLRDTAASARDTVSDAMSQAAYKAKDLGYIAAVKTADLASSGANTATSGLRFAAARALDVFNRIVRSSAETVGSGAESLRDRLDGDRMQNQRYSDIQLPWSANIGSWTVDEEKEANLELRVAISLMDKARKIMDNIALDCKNKDCRYQEEKLNRAREAERLYQQGIYRVERVLRRRMPREVHISLQEGVQEARDALYESQELIHNITGRGSAYHERPDWHATTRTFFGDDRHLLHTQRSRDEL